ncbi:hypothetical protein BAE44_0003905 [Dichanthelium oligosanthes]|uniref:Uncharacterized protein n=1 Tax=Dichanthelium oligosanthes TaxID=888268 RepID=A0A1E5WCI1_9POAL|nr:hypothetical protein BAE44_0003905 [Dichanthelium oligosanthes]
MIISGVVPCAVGVNIDTTTVPAFPVSTILPGSAPDVVTSLMGNQCNAVVTTPLAACNPFLAGTTGTLTAPMQVWGRGGIDYSGLTDSMLAEPFSSFKL